MRFNCTECNWTGDEGEIVGNALIGILCPICYGDAELDDREPDPLTEQPSEVRS